MTLFADRARTPGDIDILVNNAGISMFGATAEVEMAAYDKMFASNVGRRFFSSGRWLPGWSSAVAAGSSA